MFCTPVKIQGNIFYLERVCFQPILPLRKDRNKKCLNRFRFIANVMGFKWPTLPSKDHTAILVIPKPCKYRLNS